VPAESGYEGFPNPGGARGAELVKAKFEELVFVDGTYFCPRCAAAPRDLPVKPTRWKIHRAGEPYGVFGSPSGRTFEAGDVLRLPPPAGRGTPWLVVAVHPDADASFDGRLELAPFKESDGELIEPTGPIEDS
jgi:hypothetical protein